MRLTNELFTVLTQEVNEIDWDNLHFLDTYLVDVKTRLEDLIWDAG